MSEQGKKEAEKKPKVVAGKPVTKTQKPKEEAPAREQKDSLVEQFRTLQRGRRVGAKLGNS